jgi:hypothetical protein
MLQRTIHDDDQGSIVLVPFGSNASQVIVAIHDRLQKSNLMAGHPKIKSSIDWTGQSHLLLAGGPVEVNLSFAKGLRG